MSRKRRNTSSPEPDSPPHTKRRQIASLSSSADEYEAPARGRSKFSSVYGQHGAFPGLDDREDELFYGPASNGLEYLRMVRSEAKTVPLVLNSTAAANQNEGGEEEDTCWGDENVGFYDDDDAYVAPAVIGPVKAGKCPNIQTQYYNVLLKRFDELQSRLRQGPPTYKKTPAVAPPANSKSARRKWRNIFATIDPTPSFVARLEPETLLELVRVLAQCLRSGELSVVGRLGPWIWAATAATRQIEVLGSEEVAELRDLGKAAVERVLGQLSRHDEGQTNDKRWSKQRATEDDEILDPGRKFARVIAVHKENSSSDGRNPILDDAKNRLTNILEQGQAHDDEGHNEMNLEKSEVNVEESEKVMMILDMIITIVGEVYGQRDLLEARAVWET